ncbi:Extracellular calcium-sensing receptor [Channa argus]|uniref:Extracellular calcium-sensing receptor n=1 Tax=Channa argus TaxID=215402 RepID=A0A6G1PQW5_CHAAH|nr:Extracellular calcium-sensing receptor [Channa argus]
MDSCDHVQTSFQALFSLITRSKTVMREGKQLQSENRFNMPKGSGTRMDKVKETRMKRMLTTVKNAGLDDTTALSQSFENEIYIKRNITEDIIEILPSCLAGSPVPAVIGLASSSPTRAVAQTLGPFDIPLDDYSQYGIQAFSNQFTQQGGCVAFHLTVPKSPTVAEVHEMADRLQSSTAKVVVVFATEGQLLDLFFELSLRNVTEIQWVASEAWVTAKLLTSPRFHSLLEGTLGFSFPGVWIPGLKDFLLNVRPSPEPGMEFITMFWEELFGCRLKFEESRFQGNQAHGKDNTTGLEGDSQNSSWSLVRNNVGQISTGDENYNSAGEKPACTGSEDLRYTDSSYTDVSKVRISYSVYKAVYAVAHALHTLLNCDSPGLNKGTCDNHKLFTSRQVNETHSKYANLLVRSVLYFLLIFMQLLDHLKAVNFTNQFEEKVYFDSNGEPVPLYEIINWQKDSNSDIRWINQLQEEIHSLIINEKPYVF